MGETFSQLGSQEDENTSILPPDSAGHGSSKFFSAPCERAAGASFVTCPTCQGNKEIPRGEWLKALEIACNPGKALGSPLARGQVPLRLSWNGVGSPSSWSPSVRLAREMLTPPALVVLPSPWGFQPLCSLSYGVPSESGSYKWLLQRSWALMKKCQRFFTSAYENLTFILAMANFSDREQRSQFC